MKYLLGQISLSLLLLTAIYIWRIDERQVQSYREARDERRYAPQDSSLAGISYAGQVVKPMSDSKGKLINGGHLVLFVIHHLRADSDVLFWNSVKDLVASKNSSLGKNTQYWGVCDDGKACDKLGPLADFPLLGYMDPYQMNALGRADESNKILLFDKSGLLISRLQMTQDPQAESSSIVGAEQ